MSQPSAQAAFGERTVFVTRLAIAVLQGLALYLLTFVGTAPASWPATEPALFEPLLLVAAFAPLIALQAIGQLRVRPLLIWLGAMTLTVAGLGWHDATRGRIETAGAGGPWPWFELVFALAGALFIANVLVMDAVTVGRLTPPYPRRFDTAWKQAVQVVLGVAFVGVFWLVLVLSAALFNLVNLHFLQKLIERPWFDWPASTLALAVSIHVTDVSPTLIRGARSLALTLFSWLAPVLALILLGFLVSLPFVSLAPLWKTHSAAGMLLGAAALTVFLINTCYQDGQSAATTSPVKRVAAVAGALELAPLVGLAAWALGLRVAQYGWTAERIAAAAALLIAACYALGYALAALRLRPWLKGMESANLVAAYLVLVVFLALFSPVADPARLMTESQIARLESGAVKPGAFDFAALKFDGARWGMAALKRLRATQTGPDAATIRLAAAQAIAQDYRSPPPTMSAGDGQAQIAVYPAGRTLPPAFYRQAGGAWPPGRAPLCVTNHQFKCVARYVNMRPGVGEQIVLFDTTSTLLLDRGPDGQWRQVGIVYGACQDLGQALATGDFKLTPHAGPDIVAGGRSLAFSAGPLGC